MLVIDVSSKSSAFKKLSPLLLGAVTADGRRAKSFQRAWEYLHVYPEHVGDMKQPTPEWLKWSDAGFKDESPPTVPDDLPLFFYLDRKQLTLQKAIKQWYIPTYCDLVSRTPELYELTHQYWKFNKKIVLDDGGEGHGPILMKMLENS